MAYPHTIPGVPAFYKAPYKAPRNPANPPASGYPNPGAIVNALVALLGTADVTNPALYGVGGLLDTETLILNVNGAGPITLTFAAATTVANLAAMLEAINQTWPALLASVGGVQGNRLVLTDRKPGTIVVGAGSANANLGIAGGAGVAGTVSATAKPAILGGRPILLNTIP